MLSIGHWEGDTLVVDVIALNDEPWLGGGQGHTEPGLERGEGNHEITEKLALIHSDQEHVIERLTRPSENYLVYQVTIEDPKVLTKPWTSVPRQWSLSHEDLEEYYCTNNVEPQEYQSIKEKASAPSK